MSSGKKILISDDSVITKRFDETGEMTANPETPKRKQSGHIEAGDNLMYSLGKVFFIIGGIYYTFSLMAYAQEKYYDNKGIPFPFIQTLLIYSLSSLIAGTLKFCVFKDYSNKVPPKKAIFIGVAIVISQALSLYGFSRVSFFVGNMIKSSKTLAMLVYKFILGDMVWIRKLPRTTIISVILITVGIFAFNLAKPSTSGKETDYLGFGCLFLALFIDSYYLVEQNEVRESCKPSIMDLQLTLSGGCVLASSCFLLFKGEIREASEYFVENPDNFYMFLTTCFCSTIGQFFIYLCIHEYGNFRLTMITGSRKILTVVLSMIIFKKDFNNIQVFSVGLIIVSLLIEFSDKIFPAKKTPAPLANLAPKGEEKKELKS